LGATTACMLTTSGHVDCVGNGSANLIAVY
jgi:hypothetical protein